MTDFLEGTATATNLEFEITGGQELGGIALGTSRDKVRGRLAGPAISWSSDVGSQSYEHYWDSGLVVGFDEQGEVTEVIAQAPAKPSLDSIALIGVPYRNVVASLSRGPRVVELSPSQLRITDLQVEAWTASADNEGLPIVAVAISRKG